VIPNITRGDGFREVLQYLVGPGKRNEHTLPHLVAGDTPLMTWFDTGELSPAAARQLAAELALPTRLRGAGPKAGAVWHCSLSLPAEDGAFTDEQWAQVAYEFMDGMGWTPEVSDRAPLPWLAVHHGTSVAGNDHIHLVVSMVREDGTFVDGHNDQVKAQQVCRHLEIRLGIRQLEGRPLGIAGPGLKPAEIGISARTGREPARRRLEREVRAAAATAGTEAQFVELVRAAGLRIAPYFAAGRNDVVAGYRVGLRGEGERMFGGGHLSRDLTLPRLRQRWLDTPEAHLAAAGAWRIADRADRAGQPTPPPPQSMQSTPMESSAAAPVVSAGPVVDFDAVNRALYEQRERLRHLPPTDTLAWTTVAQDVAGILSAWSRQVEGITPGPIAAAARSVRRLAQIRRSTAAGTQPQRVSNTGAVLLAYSISHGGQGRIAQAIFLRQLLNTMKALHDAAIAMNQLRIAQAIQAAAVDNLRALQESLPAIPDAAFSTGCPTIAEAEAALNSAGDVRKPPTATVGSVRPLGRPIPNRPSDGERAGHGRKGRPPDFER
jgi:hypothetical protein